MCGSLTGLAGSEPGGGQGCSLTWVTVLALGWTRGRHTGRSRVLPPPPRLPTGPLPAGERLRRGSLHGGRPHTSGPAVPGLCPAGRDLAGAVGRAAQALVPARRDLSQPTGTQLDSASPPQAHGQTFTFPDLFPESKLNPEGGSVDDRAREQLLEAQQRRESRDPRRGGVPAWFGL